MKTLKANSAVHLGPTEDEVVKPGQLFEADDKLAERLIADGHASEYEPADEEKIVKAAKSKSAPKGKGNKTDDEL